jgi:hypothetical protein
VTGRFGSEVPNARREEAWAAANEGLPARWRLGPPSRDSPSAHGPSRRSRRIPNEARCLRWSPGAASLRGVPRDKGRLDELRRRARLAYVEGARAGTRRITGQAMTAGELERVIERAVHMPADSS